jgi:hypothetical protein
LTISLRVRCPAEHGCGHERDLVIDPDCDVVVLGEIVDALRDGPVTASDNARRDHRRGPGSSSSTRPSTAISSASATAILTR